MSTDKAWTRFGDVDPYYGVVSWPEFRADRLTEQTRAKFFQSGEIHAEELMSTLHDIDAAFHPGRTLDFGCGVGRVSLALARWSDSVVGVDVAPGMLLEAQRNAQGFGIDNVTFAKSAEGLFDLVHSFIVLQHIPPRRGMTIVTDLLSCIADDGMIALHVPYRREAPMWRKAATAVKRQNIVANGLLNVIQRRSFSYPAMTMYCYNIADMMEAYGRGGVEILRVVLSAPSQQGGYAGVMIYGKKRKVRA